MDEYQQFLPLCLLKCMIWQIIIHSIFTGRLMHSDLGDVVMRKDFTKWKEHKVFIGLWISIRQELNVFAAGHRINNRAFHPPEYKLHVFPANYATLIK